MNWVTSQMPMGALGLLRQAYMPSLLVLFADLYEFDITL